MKTCEIGLICFKNLMKLLFEISRKAVNDSFSNIWRR